MLGLFEINGPISAVFDEANPADTIGQINPYSWTNKANMLYIDNPVGAGTNYITVSSTYSLMTSTGFSHTNNGFAQNQTDVGVDLYECLTQFFELFPEYVSNDFYVFGESYAGTYMSKVISLPQEQFCHQHRQVCPHHK